ncbi:dTDP-4-dehydrorhamnose 3,5-epimerase [Shewanella cyperi]|uniref:dTDP-4-dehydrorhamnose 3,5-epimerase n=1 Tax=Shewanella cyperi TaxID=2814292 RepID=A0A974XKI2_9GAMM|nr:dTDP-4-dehydrorhamnose 3,5-epimerase [Shewanella cyperi]QSX28918.1 dTDP-4-dehydrorhamnose 3,5-epimerase [Shewanella cyperi]
MKVIDTKIPDVKIIEPQVFGDDRGFFMEAWNQNRFEELVTGKPTQFVQDNHSKSIKGVLRGLHYQVAPFAQAKLVRCVVGEVFDVAVDLRTTSPTLGQWVGIKLSAENKRQLWIPEGFAHGFLTLSDTAEFLYKTTEFYSSNSERGIKWDDNTINIDWGVGDSEIVLSEKDKFNSSFNGAELF